MFAGIHQQTGMCAKVVDEVTKFTDVAADAFAFLKFRDRTVEVTAAPQHPCLDGQAALQSVGGIQLAAQRLIFAQHRLSSAEVAVALQQPGLLSETHLQITASAEVAPRTSLLLFESCDRTVEVTLVLEYPCLALQAGREAVGRVEFAAQRLSLVKYDHGPIHIAALQQDFGLVGEDRCQARTQAQLSADLRRLGIQFGCGVEVLAGEVNAGPGSGSGIEPRGGRRARERVPRRVDTAPSRRPDRLGRTGSPPANRAHALPRSRSPIAADALGLLRQGDSGIQLTTRAQADGLIGQGCLQSHIVSQLSAESLLLVQHLQAPPAGSP